MRTERILPAVLAAALAMPCYSAEVIFARRVYAAQGRTYHQICSLDTVSRRVTPLTKTQRRHLEPAGAAGGQRIWFLSGAFGDERNTELWFADSRTHAEKLAAGFKGNILRLLGGDSARAFFVADDGSGPALYRWDGRVTRLSPVDSAAERPAALSPDARTLAVKTSDAPSAAMMEPSGARGHTVENCSEPLWSSDGRKLACVSGSRIRVVNLTTGVEAAHADFSERATPPLVADFAPDGTRLLVKTVGANTSSTSPQWDFWLLEIAAAKWTYVGPGQSAIFAPGGSLLLVTPRELAQVSKGRDWICRLMLIDPATHAQTPVAPAIANDADPSRWHAQSPVAAPRRPAAPRKPTPSKRR